MMSALTPSHLPRLSARFLRVAGIVVSAASLGAVAWWAAHQQAPRLPAGPREIGAVVLAIVNYGLTTLVRGERWRLLLRRAGARPSRADCQALTAVGYMGNNVLPARAGDVMRVYLMAPRAGAPARTVIGTLLAERVLDVVILFALFGVLAYGVLHGAGVGHRRAEVVVVALVAVAVVAAAGAVAARRVHAVQRLRRFLGPMLAAVVDLRSGFGLRMLALSALIWLMEAGTWWLCGVAVGLGADPLQAVYLVALSSLFILIPAGPGYAGTLDAAVVVGVKAIGGTGRAAISYLLMLRFVLLVPITLVGLLALMVRYGGRARLGVAWGTASEEAC